MEDFPVDATDDEQPAASAPTDAASEEPSGPCPPRRNLLLSLQFEGAVEDESLAHLPIGPTVRGFAEGPSGRAADLAATTHLTMAGSALLYGAMMSMNGEAVSHQSSIASNQCER